MPAGRQNLQIFTGLRILATTSSPLAHPLSDVDRQTAGGEEGILKELPLAFIDSEDPPRKSRPLTPRDSLGEMSTPSDSRPSISSGKGIVGGRGRIVSPSNRLRAQRLPTDSDTTSRHSRQFFTPCSPTPT